MAEITQRYVVYRADGQPMGDCIVMEFSDHFTRPAAILLASTVNAAGYPELADLIRERSRYYAELKEAIKNQLLLHERIDAGANIPESDWRSASLRAGYEIRSVPEYGMGRFSVNVETGEVCEFKGAWFADGKVLLCTECFEEGT